MAYDAARAQVVLFGGGVGASVYADTWVWDGNNWTQEYPANSPPARSGHALAYDAARGQVVLFGGNNADSMILRDTWVWDGTNWAQAFPASSPPARTEFAMAYDSARAQVTLFGGKGTNNFSLADTWVWDGSNWSQMHPASSPAARWSHAMAYDFASSQVVLYGGIIGEIIEPAVGDTWVWNGNTWAERDKLLHPPPRQWTSMSGDSRRGQIVLYGGNRKGLQLSDTWVWSAQ
jgi:hypothetical protein